MNKVVLSILWLLPLASSAQSYFDGLHKEFEVGAFVPTSGRNPFWLRNNQFGVIPTDGPGVTLRARISPNRAKPVSGFLGYTVPGRVNARDLRAGNSLQQKKQDFKFDYAVEVAVNAGKTNQFLLPEAYATVQWKGLELTVGRRREIYGLTDSTLSAGSYIWSGNSLPVPKIQLSTPGYVQLGNSPIGIKLGINHGFVADNGTVQNFYIHQKWLYGRIGRKDSKFKLYGGFNHNAQWGGYSEELEDIDFGQITPTIDGYLAPFPLYSYQFVLIPFLQKFVDIDQSKVPGFDAGLAIGNQLGSVDIGASFENDNVKVDFFHQIPYDYARSIANLYNIEDGNNTISLTFKENVVVRKVLFEYLNTTSQGRYRFGKLTTGQIGEVDNYFSHGQYQRWSYEDKIIGTPFINMLNVDGYKYVNNRVHAFSVATNGELNGLFYLFRYSYMHGIGTYGIPQNIKQNYILLNLSKALQRSSSVNLQLAADIGNTEKNSLGIFTSYKLSL